MKQNPFRSFGNYVLRTPLLPLSFFKELTKENHVDIQKLKATFSENKIVQEAIFLASATLSERLQKWCSNQITDIKEVEKLTFSLLKYLSRMSSRCTPFGLFAGTGVGKFDQLTNIELEPYRKFKRHTRLDMNYLIALSQNLAKEPSIKRQLLFYPNSSLYRIGNEWRYIEYHYNKNNKRVHQMVSLEDADYLRNIITEAKKGAYLSDLVPLLVDHETSKEDALEFIDELVNSQLLISELEPSVSGPEFSTQLTTCLKKLRGNDSLNKVLDQVNEMIKSLDTELGNSSKSYLQITNTLETLGTSFELKNMFQTDMILSLKSNSLCTSIERKALKAMSLLARITPPREETFMDKFGVAFYERFENREIPLAKALDVEVGIGYKQNQGNSDVNYLIDDIFTVINRKSSSNTTLSLTPAQHIIHRKLIESIRLKKEVIQLDDTDFEQFKLNWNDLTDTVPTMIQLVKEGNQQKIVLEGFGGSSAVNLLARFCHGDDEINRHSKNITRKEFDINEGKILAEIVHLPEARVGNVLMRPSFRDYEIPYLAKSILTTKKQLSIDDLVVSARPDGKVTLRSISKNKEVLPRLANAHNFSSQSLPIYHFLADLQTQGRRMLGFSWGNLAQMYTYLPRVEYEDMILSKAQWTISKKEIESLIKAKNDDQKLAKALSDWTKVFSLPKYVLLVESDNELLINTHNHTSIRMLLNEVKKKEQFQLKESLYAGDTLVKQDSNQYTNQVILSFFNTTPEKTDK